MNRPYIICHMLMSIDGKVTGDYLSKPESNYACEQYYRLNREYQAKAFACGRVTMESSFTNSWYPDLSKFQGLKVPRTDYIACDNATLYAVSFDRKGKLGWKKSIIEDEDPGYGNAHIIEVLCEDVKDEYLIYLRSIGVSYIFAGKSEMNILNAVEKLTSLFNIDKLLLEGGSIINGAFVKEDVIDELSIVVVPLIAETNDKSLFDKSKITKFKLEDFRHLGNDVLYLKYKK